MGQLTRRIRLNNLLLSPRAICKFDLIVNLSKFLASARLEDSLKRRHEDQENISTACTELVLVKKTLNLVEHEQ
jgi:hypothetical protein